MPDYGEEGAVEPARRLWELYETVHSVTYFGEESQQAAADLGLRGFWMGYFALRAAPLGAVGPAAVTALFAGFAPERVARALPDAWSYTRPVDALRVRRAAAAATLRRVGVSDGAGMAEAVDVLWRAVSGAGYAGRALGAANAALARPADPVEALWQACTTLREHRGDGHVAVLVGRGVDPVEAHLVKVAAGEAREDMLQTSRHWPAGAWSAARDRLRARGWLAGDALTDAGHAAHAAVEEDTDRLAAGPWTVLGADGAARAEALLRPVADAVTRSEILPRGNPTGLTRTLPREGPRDGGDADGDDEPPR